MIKNVQVDEALSSQTLIEGPVKIEDAIISNSAKKRIILAGSRGSGRSIVLGYKERKSVGTKNPAILTRFESVGMFGSKEDGIINKDFMEHYYEVLMCHKILGYIKKYYPLVYESGFRGFNVLTLKRLQEVDEYIKNAYFTDVSLEQWFYSGRYTSELVSAFKKAVHVEAMTLMIDRFDWTHNSDPRVQDILKNYFDMFDKIIITSDDEGIGDRSLELADNGFDIMEVDYCKNPKIVRQIVERRFICDDARRDKRTFPIYSITSDDYKNLVDRTGGNISVILDTLMETEAQFYWDYRGFDMSKQLDLACTAKLEIVEQLKGMGKAKQLHL